MLFPLNLLSHRPLIWWLLCSKSTLKSWFLRSKDLGKLWNSHIIKNDHMFSEQEWLEMMNIISLHCHGRQTKLCLEQGGEALLLTRPGLLWSWGPPHHSSRAQLEWERYHSSGESGWCPPPPHPNWEHLVPELASGLAHHPGAPSSQRVGLKDIVSPNRALVFFKV